LLSWATQRDPGQRELIEMTEIETGARPVGTLATQPKGDGVQVLMRAADILWALRAHPEGYSLSQLAKTLGLARPTVHRIVNTLKSIGFVAELPGGRVKLGAALAVLGAAADHELATAVRPYLKALSHTVKESVMLATLEGDELVCIEFIASAYPQSLQAVTATGTPIPLHCTAVGKSLLSELTADEFARLAPRDLEPYTPNTICSHGQLSEDLERVRALGVAFDREDWRRPFLT
jgi:DNA-binding IclR family transcriptional regulator